MFTRRYRAEQRSSHHWARLPEGAPAILTAQAAGVRSTPPPSFLLSRLLAQREKRDVQRKEPLEMNPRERSTRAEGSAATYQYTRTRGD